MTIERKRTWDEVDSDTGDGIGLSVDVGRLDQAKRQKLGKDQVGSEKQAEGAEAVHSSDDEGDSMIDADSEEDAEESIDAVKVSNERTATARATSPIQSTTSTNLDCTPEALAAKYPTLFSTNSSTTPKILITTGINGTLHSEADLLTNLFPNSVYIPRSSHRYSHRFSVREISSFATNRRFTAVVVLKEDLKRLTGLSVVHLPAGPTFHFSVSVSCAFDLFSLLDQTLNESSDHGRWIIDQVFHRVMLT